MYSDLGDIFKAVGIVVLLSFGISIQICLLKVGYRLLIEEYPMLGDFLNSINSLVIFIILILFVPLEILLCM